MNGMFETVEQFFKDQGWKFSQVPDKPVITMGMSGKNGQYQCVAIVRAEKDLFVFRAIGGVNVPEEKRLAVAEFLTRANYGLSIGNFEMDYRDGEVAYKTSVDVEGDELTAALVNQLVHANLSTMDRYYPGLMKIIYADATPEEAVKEIESQ